MSLTSGFSNVKPDWSSGNLSLLDISGNTILAVDGTNRKLTLPNGVFANDRIVHNQRIRTTTANVNSGATLLPAVAGYKYRIVNWTMIAVGGSAATATAITISGTQSSSVVALATVAVAALTQSTAVGPNSANVTNLADGAAFVTCDANTAITIGKTGSSLGTATNIDVIISYVLEAA